MDMQTIEKELVANPVKINFEIGDTVKVHYKIIEGNKERIQIYEGIVIAIDGKGISKTFTVRKVSYDVGVERVFPVYSPKVAKVESLRKAKIRRSKLYYLRDRKGKSAKLKEQIYKKVGKVSATAAAADAAETQPAAE
jgi:large subunit ribosomal protein L19